MMTAKSSAIQVLSPGIMPAVDQGTRNITRRQRLYRPGGPPRRDSTSARVIPSLISSAAAGVMLWRRENQVTAARAAIKTRIADGITIRERRIIVYHT